MVGVKRNHSEFSLENVYTPLQDNGDALPVIVIDYAFMYVCVTNEFE